VRKYQLCPYLHQPLMSYKTVVYCKRSCESKTLLNHEVMSSANSTSLFIRKVLIIQDSCTLTKPRKCQRNIWKRWNYL